GEPTDAVAVQPVSSGGAEGQIVAVAGHDVVPKTGDPGHGIETLLGVEGSDGLVASGGGADTGGDGQGRGGDKGQLSLVTFHVKEGGGAAGLLHQRGGGTVGEGGLRQQHGVEKLRWFRFW